jgi:hypothetical protein
MLELIFFVFVAIVLAWVIFVFFTKRGRGVLFGGRIMKTYDGISAKRRIFSNRVKVHAVDGGAVRFVGLEVSISSIGSYQMMPLSFPASEAKQLAQMLIEAAEYEEGPAKK